MTATTQTELGNHSTNTQTNDSDSDHDAFTREINDADDIHDAVDEFIDEILNAADDAAATGRLTEYLEQAAAIGVGRYSPRNQLALMAQLNARDVDYKHTARHWGGFWTWQNDYGRSVKKGETGYKILAPVTGPACPDCGNAPNYHDGNDSLDCPRAGEDPDAWDFNPREEWSEGVYYFRAATTFALQQTEPLEDADPDEVFTPDNHTRGDEDRAAELFAALRAAAEAGAFRTGPITVEENVGLGSLGAKGAAAGGMVDVITGDRPKPDQFRTLTHEIAHELLHFEDAGDDVPRAVAEVEAEAIAYTVAEYFGFDADDSDLYVGAWVKHARDAAANADTGDEDEADQVARDLIRDRLDSVQETAAEIIEVIETQRDEDDEGDGE